MTKTNEIEGQELMNYLPGFEPEAENDLPSFEPKEIKKSNANRTGKNAENQLKFAFKDVGCTVFLQHTFKNVLTQYNTQLRCDLFVLNFPGYEKGLIVESKWQTVSGTADEKFPLLVLNIKTRYPYPTIVVEDGGGARDKAKKWLRESVGGNLIAVFSFMELLNWINKCTS